MSILDADDQAGDDAARTRLRLTFLFILAVALLLAIQPDLLHGWAGR